MTVLLALTMGVWVMISVSGVSPDPVPALAGPAWAVWLAFAVASFFAVLGWAIMFNSPLWMAPASGVIAVLGNLPRLALIDAGVKPHVATFLACFFMGVLCAIAVGWFDMEKIIMTVPTLLVSIPGSAALRTLVSFDQADVVHALASGVETVLVAIAMVAGLAGGPHAHRS